MTEHENIRLLAAFEGENAIGITMVAMRPFDATAELHAVQSSKLHRLPRAQSRGEGVRSRGLGFYL